jgi:putative Mg2+ transporter-C (MgtC) family protein
MAMVEGVAELGWLESFGRLALACLLGGVLGLEREYDGQDAGFRTHLLVVLGCALFGLMSVGAFDDFVTERADTNVVVDVTRIAAYVAPGIGFIGGGVILKYGGRVSGITTAASLWSAAAIGVACGLGLWGGAVLAAAFTLLALEALRPLSALVARMGRRRRSAVFVELSGAADVSTVMAAINEPSTGRLKQLRYGIGPDDEGQISAEFWRAPSDAELTELANRLLAMDGVVGVSVGANA